ncbi:MAG TPA: S-methyl-5-thioribose-1-phosphate isomerase [Methanoculleus sp.]|nr:S-methyl-5-thioribose-1-phosphate isomerase [Methanoculleus sp.]
MQTETTADRTITWDEGGECLRFIEQTLLPERCEIIATTDVERLATAIRRLEVRGAPALGVAGAYGVALSARSHRHAPPGAFMDLVHRDAAMLQATRPTAVNLGWGIRRVLAALDREEAPGAAAERALEEARATEEEEVRLCHAIGEHGAALLPDSCTVLTHCNAGALACVEWGTALGVVRSAVQMGKEVKVISCETRPLHQGSRLTAFELARDGIDVETITDSTAAYLMRKKVIDAVFVGADRITRDVVFNKVGTYMHAVCACHHDIPFYVAAPYSTLDLQHSEADITVEERAREELAACGGRKLMPDGVRARNYAFDATPLGLVTAIITEQGARRL